MKYIDNGFGFPITLDTVEMRNVRGIPTPVIDYLKLSEEVLELLANQDLDLKGAELKFVRHKLKLTYEDFASLFNVSSENIKDWEDNNREVSISNEVKQYVRKKLNADIQGLS
jgi:DNA-binding transcriptional regulator YiaG